MLGAGVGALRVLRALVFVAVVTSLTIGAHVLAGGSVSGLAVVCLTALAWPVALLGSRRQGRVRHLFPALLAGQLAGHGVLAFLGSAGSAGGSSGSSVVTACSATAVHPGHHVLHCGEPASAVMAGAGHGPAMTGAHFAAALLLAAVLAWGEALLWRIVDVILPARPSVPPLRRGAAPASFVVASRPRALSCLTVRGRGPPVAA